MMRKKRVADCATRFFYAYGPTAVKSVWVICTEPE